MSRSTSNVVAAPKAFGADSQKTVASDGGSYISYHRIAEHLARFYRDKRVRRLSDSKKMNKRNFEIRDATVADVPIILQLILDLATYERAPNDVVATEEGLHEVLFGTEPAAKVVIAFENTAPVGFAVYFFNFSTWLGRPGLYLEDLFVKTEMRGRGYGRALLVHLAKIARDHNCGRMEWAVLTWNEPAIEFYKKIGAVPLEEWRVFRLTSDGIGRLAAS
jgi:GNAT superfamily N-acetyltransferase